MKDFLEQLNRRRLQAYAADPGLLKEHYGIEQTVLAGGYGYRQIFELVQNGADAVLEAHQHDMPSAGGNRIQVLLSESRLYVANTGAPLSEEGLDALLRSHTSPKRGNQIGRFGLGFKSLLKLEGRIDLFTRAGGAIRFDPQRCRDQLKQQFNVSEAPCLRLAWPLDEAERAADSICAALAWAETIVRVDVRSKEIHEHLRQEISGFPAEFLLFFPVTTVLTLDNSEQSARELRLEHDGDQRLLHDGSDKSRWHVSERELRVTDARALADATHIHARKSVPLGWAVPLEGRREEAGRFWAFFPTHTPTYVPGILNAPWKLNSDRNAIIGGEWNTALMAGAASLVADTLPKLSSPTDPGGPLDAFPRQPGRTDEDAAPLLAALWKLLEQAPVIADATGKLTTGTELWRHPRSNASLAEKWQALASPEHASQFVHPACLEGQRNSRLNALAERLTNTEETASSARLRACEAVSWFKAVASADSAKAIKVLELAEAYANDCKPSEWNAVRPQLAIIPSTMGKLLTASRVVLAPEGTRIPGRATVAPALYNDSNARRILADVMKVQAPDDTVWEQVLSESMRSVPHYPPEARDIGWRLFWVRLRQAPGNVRDRFIQQHRGEIHIRRRDGTWVTADNTLLPGALIEPDDTSANQNFLVDEAVHAKDGATLAAIGVSQIPQGDVRPAIYDSSLSEWLSACRHLYKRTHDNSASWGYLEPFSLTMPRGFAFLTQLIATPNARLTAQYLERIAERAFARNIQFGHSTTRAYPKIDVPHPLPWFVLRYGSVEIGAATVRLAAVMARRDEDVLSKLAAWAESCAAFERLEDTFPRARPSKTDICELWLAVIAELATPAAIGDDALSDLWSAASKDGVVPAALPSSKGPVPLDGIFVTGSPDLARRARMPDRIVVTLDESTLDLWVDRGARNLSQLLEPKWAETIGSTQLLTAAIPELTEVLRAEVLETARCQPVSNLKLKLAETSEPVPCLMWQSSLLLDTERLAQSPRAERLRLVLNEIAPAGWLVGTPEEALQHLGDARVDALRAEVAQGSTLAERLLRAVGNRRKPLLEALSALKDLDFIQQCAPLKLAELTLAQLGPATLTTLKDTLSAEGLKPPARWNTSEARAFVISIGFPAEFASAPETKRDAEETISGPIELPRLHDFQEEVMQGLEALFASGSKRRRAVISLPTGGGKTRVTVEAAVQLVLAPEGDTRSVIWVAQTDELCEQAVQAFRQVWVNLGALRTDLRIVRLWGGNPNPAIPTPDRPVVVVASIQTLNTRMGTEGLAWLRKPGLVVLDECHHAITLSYSNLLRWLDAEAPRRGAQPKDEPLIVGLSATPFRTDDDESKRLARRFDNRWLPADQETLPARLRRQGVLAQAIYEALPSGAGLLNEEIEQLARVPESWEGLDFDNLLEAINQRLAGDPRRNARLVEHIRQSTERSILFFANSVQHAAEMSARLNLAGISAAAVSGSTCGRQSTHGWLPTT